MTHSTEQVVTHCDRAVLLERGRKVADGLPRPIVNQYLDLLYGRTPAEQANPVPGGEPVPVELPVQLHEFDPDFASRPEPLFASRPLYNPYEHRWGDRRAEVMDFALFAGAEAFPQQVRARSTVTCYVRCRFSASLVRPIFGITLKTKEGLTVYGTNTEMTRMETPLSPEAGSGVIRCTFELNCAPGDYFVSVGIASRDASGEVVPHDRRYDAVHLCVEAADPFMGITDLGARLRVL